MSSWSPGQGYQHRDRSTTRLLSCSKESILKLDRVPQPVQTPSVTKDINQLDNQTLGTVMVMMMEEFMEVVVRSPPVSPCYTDQQQHFSQLSAYGEETPGGY